MSEVTPTPEELVEEVSFTVDDATVIPMPIDPTLSHEGEAADAKATGDAIAGVIDDLRVNEKAPVNKKITIYAGDIKMSSETGAQSIAQAFDGISGKTAADVMYDTEELISVKDALDDIYEQMDTDLTTAEIDDLFDEVFGGEE